MRYRILRYCYVVPLPYVEVVYPSQLNVIVMKSIMGFKQRLNLFLESTGIHVKQQCLKKYVAQENNNCDIGGLNSRLTGARPITRPPCLCVDTIYLTFKPISH